MQRTVFHLIMVGLLLSSTVLPAHGYRVRKTIEEVRRTKRDRAAEGIAVEVEAQVMRINPVVNNLFIFDGQFGIYVRGPKDLSVVKGLKAGDLVRIEGITTAGGFLPDINARKIEVIGHKPRPVGRPIQNNDIYSTGTDCAWVEIKGRLISSRVVQSKTSILLEVSRNEAVLYVQLPYSAENEKKIPKLLFSWVKFNAVLGTVYNTNRQALGRVYYAHSVDDFSVTGSEFQMNAKRETAVHELMQFLKPYNRPVRTGGTVLYAGPSEVYLRGEQACLKVFVNEEFDTAIGDEVVVEGIIWPQPVSPALRTRSIEVSGKSEAPAPVRVKVDPTIVPVIDPVLNYDLIELDAELMERGKDFFGTESESIHTMRCRSKGVLFEVRVPVGVELDEKLKPGVRMRLTGICNVLRNTDRAWFLSVEGFWLQLRSLDDIQILETASWWTKEHLLGISGILLGAVMLFLVWIGLLRRTVSRQTSIIHEKVAQETVLTERQRIARELHDTLEQGLTALAVQMRNIRKGFELNAESGGRSVDLAENMLRVCREESRASIVDLRGGILEKMGLYEAIRHTLELQVKGRPLNLDVQIPGDLPLFDPFAERHLLRMITEAVNNAVKHAGAENLLVKLVCSEETLELSVRDDGCGFDMSRGAPQGHFGLVGMQERANRLHGVLTIESEPGKGTELSFSMPVEEFLREGMNHG